MDNKTEKKAEKKNSRAGSTVRRDLLADLRNGVALDSSALILLTLQLSLPAILGEVSTVVMEYIDAAMLGHLGSGEAASIGLVASSTWLMGGISAALSTGFTVLIAQEVGAGNLKTARSLMVTGLLLGTGFSVLVALVSAAIHRVLPFWLGGIGEVAVNGGLYFMIFSLFLPAHMLCHMAGGMLRATGDMHLPAAMQVLMCILDVVFNFFLIFSEMPVTVFGQTFCLRGFGLSVIGAALGTGLAELCITLILLYCLLVRSPMLKLHPGEGIMFLPGRILQAVRIALPVGAGSVIMCSAYVMNTRIIAPFGMTAIAANSFGISIESLCYMPGYGIGNAATTLIGQSIGAGKHREAEKLGWLTTAVGMLAMLFMGILMFVFAPALMRSMSPDPDIIRLGTLILRIEAFAEPLYGASIIIQGVYRGAGETLVPNAMNFVSMWLVRLPLAFILSGCLGLTGVWLAMCLELCFRGIIFLLFLRVRPLSRYVV